MAERRMFAKSIVTSDTFLDMEFSTRCLYFALGMYADDDGFVDSPKSVMRQTGATRSDLDELCKNSFVIPCESGVIVITHWNVNNNIRKDRKKPTLHTEELKKLSVQNGVYVLKNDACQPNDNQTATDCQPNGCIGKARQGKDSLGKDSIGKANAPAHVHAHTRESFCELYGIAADAEPPPDMDFEKLSEAYSESKSFLQDRAFAKRLSWIAKNYSKIIAGDYKDFQHSASPPTPTEQYAKSINDLFTEISEDDT